MFAQLITARVADAAGLRKEMDRWREELAPSAAGFRGATAGVTDDGRYVALALFSDAGAAQENSGRPEQDAWWRELESHLSGPATFDSTEQVDVLAQGWSPRAQFVQVMEGRTADPDGMRQRSQQSGEQLRALRPDLLGVVSLWFDDGRYADVAFFTSEAEAREAERREMPEELRADYEEMVASVERYSDLHDPWHAPPTTA
jgi:hypothetical protein